jgi:hypothetical protein
MLRAAVNAAAGGRDGGTGGVVLWATMYTPAGNRAAAAVSTILLAEVRLQRLDVLVVELDVGAEPGVIITQ